MDTKAQKRSRRGRTQDGKPNPVDVHVGKKIRLRRQVLSFSQEKLGEMAGLTFQQIQKYEHGKNRISASRLWDISQILNVPITYFFSDMDEETRSQSPRFNSGAPHVEDDIIYNSPDPMYEEKAMLLVSAFNSITDSKAADHLLKLILAMSSKSFSEM